MLRYLLLFLSFKAVASFDWQAHRGGRGLYPENTTEAMKRALKYPITTLELDVVVSKDNQVVVSHEPWMSEEICTSPSGPGSKGEALSGREVNLYRLDYSEIKKYDCGTKSHPRFPRQLRAKEQKPLLFDLLTELKDSGKNFNIEIKSTPQEEAQGFQPQYQKFTDEVLAVILRVLPETRFSIQSFDWRVLKYAHQKYPQVPLVALIERSYQSETIIRELGFKPGVFSPSFDNLSAADVAYFHRQKVKVIPWTVNTPELMKKMLAMHVDGIITDYPDLIEQVPTDLTEIKPECGPNANRFEGACVKIPKNAEVSEQNPGWVCLKGHVQKRMSCEKIKLPKHAYFQEDGKTWVCKKGYEHYRYKCRKK